MTEEMEEGENSTLYDDYRFVTRAELERIGLASAVGTQLLRPYMHGFFIDSKLYGKAAALLAPFDYGAYRASKVREKLDAERGSRITLQRRLPRVNTSLAARLMAAEGDAERGDGDESGEDAAGGAAADSDDEEQGRGKRQRAADGEAADGRASLLHDPRFGAMFTDADFTIDEQSEEYLRLHPNVPRPEGDGGPRLFAARGELPAFGNLAPEKLAARALPLGARRDGDGEEGGRGGRGAGRGGRGGRGRGGRGRGHGR